jgi:acyl-coenzyme A thioesterase 13
MVDLGGSLAVASRGLYATGVSTDLNVTYLSSGGQVGDSIKAEVTCDKCMSWSLFFSHCTDWT